MRYCTRCGHALGVGRFCTSCGARVVPPAEGAPVQHPPVQPPPAASVPPPPRFPLYADTVATPAQETPPAPVRGEQPPRRRRGWLPWVAAVAVLLVIAIIGAVLLVSGGDDPAAEEGRAQADDRTSRESEGQRGAAPDVDLAADAAVEVPATAPASADNDGNPVTFVAENMTDGDPRTCWRMAGDASGSVLTFAFDGPVEISSVGLVNGYAKTDPPDDWYAANRRILAVTWIFDDGTEVSQDLTETRDVQSIDVERIGTTTVQLRIDEVSSPGRGASGRDFTAISDVTLGGASG